MRVANSSCGNDVGLDATHQVNLDPNSFVPNFTFSMIKRLFEDYLLSRTKTAMVNEVLCKILCHNLCVLIRCMYELEIEPEFWQNGEKISKAS